MQRFLPSLRVSGLALALGVTTAAGAHAASTATPSAPVTISSCVGGLNSIELVEIANYDVSLRNNAAVPADEIRLSVHYGRRGKRATFDLKEAFAPGADVSRHLHRTVNGGLYAYWSDHNDCTIDYVHFTNGTSWTRPPDQPKT